MSTRVERLELEHCKPSSFYLEEGKVIHRQCGSPMTLLQRALSGEERWFCTTCTDSIYLPQEAWLFLMEQLRKDEGKKVDPIRMRGIKPA